MSGQGADELRIRGILRSRGVGHDAPHPDAVTAAAAAALTAPTPQPQPPGGGASDDWWDALYPGPDTAPATDTEPDAAAQPRASRRRIPEWWTGQHVDTAAPDDEPDEVDEEPDDEEDLDDQDEDEEDDEDQDEDEQDAQPRSRPRSRSRREKLRKTRPAKSRKRRRDPHAPSSPLDTAPRRSLLDAIAAVPPRIRWLIVHTTAAAAGYRLGWVDYATRTTAWLDEHGWLSTSGVFWCCLAVGCEAFRYRARHTRLIIRWLAAIPIASIVAGTALYGTGWQTLDLGVFL